jgi:plastocyanin
MAFALFLPLGAAAQNATLAGQIVFKNAPPGKKTPPGLNTVVWLVPAGGTAVDPPLAGRGPFRLEQKHKSFLPHVLVVPVGSTVEFPNDDPFFHNVFSLFEGKRFDLGLYEAGTTRHVTFDRPGICYIFCNIHSEMSAIVIVLAAPFYGISDEHGRIEISGVPPGNYQMHIWQERADPNELNSLTRAITLTEGSNSFGTLTLTAAPLSTHTNKYGEKYEAPSPDNPIYVQP